MTEPASQITSTEADGILPQAQDVERVGRALELMGSAFTRIRAQSQARDHLDPGSAYSLSDAAHNLPGLILRLQSGDPKVDRSMLDDDLDRLEKGLMMAAQ